MRENAKRNGGSTTSASSSREQWEKLFEDYFGRPWDASTREQVLAAVRQRSEAAWFFREMERIVVGVAALTRVLAGFPPATEEPPRIFPPERKRDERYLLVWAFEERVVPFASATVTPRALAVVSLLMGYEPDSHQEDAIRKAATRMKTTRRRYRRERPPTMPESMRRVAYVQRFRALDAPLRQAFDALLEVVEGIVQEDESVPVGTLSQS